MKRLIATLTICIVIVAGCSRSGSGPDDEATCTRPARPAPSGPADELIVTGLGDPQWTMTSDEETFSSPKTVDLNRDGVLDVVQGFGQDTFGARASSLVATDGATGEELWRSTGHEDLIGSATFAPLGGDTTIDVVIGGRRGALHAIDGADGSRLWSFDEQNGRWFNFYTNQFVPDQNGDGVVDLAVANGGLVFDEPSEQAPGAVGPRNVGYLFIISGGDGSVIASAPVPDRAESYMSALIEQPADRNGETAGDIGVTMLVGTGGETLPGALWRVPLASLLDGTTDGAERLVDGGSKGIIATPSRGLLTDDCIADIVVQAFDGTITAIDGSTNAELWTVANPGFETYATPTLGYLVGDDDVPDVFASVARGVWPDYVESDYLLVDGATGEVTWRDTLGTFAPSGFAAVDLNGDGRDEVIFAANDEARNRQLVHVLDSTRGELHTLVTLDQTTFAAPWVGDLDGDGQLDLITTESAYQASGPATVRRYTLGFDSPGRVSWGGYLGNETDGRLGR